MKITSSQPAACQTSNMKPARELRLWITQKFCRNSSPINLFDEKYDFSSFELGGRPGAARRKGPVLCVGAFTKAARTLAHFLVFEQNKQLKNISNQVCCNNDENFACILSICGRAPRLGGLRLVYFRPYGTSTSERRCAHCRCDL